MDPSFFSRTCVQCRCLKSISNFSKAQQKKPYDNSRCKTCVERGEDLPFKPALSSSEDLSSKVETEVLISKGETPLPLETINLKDFAKFRKEFLPGFPSGPSGSPGMQMKGPVIFTCTFCLMKAKSHQVKKYDSNLVCILCEERLNRMDIPLDLSKEEQDRLKKALMNKLYITLIKDAIGPADFALAGIGMKAIPEMAKKDWDKTHGKTQQEWLDTH